MHLSSQSNTGLKILNLQYFKTYSLSQSECKSLVGRLTFSFLADSRNRWNSQGTAHTSLMQKGRMKNWEGYRAVLHSETSGISKQHHRKHRYILRMDWSALTAPSDMKKTWLVGKHLSSPVLPITEHKRFFRRKQSMLFSGSTFPVSSLVRSVVRTSEPKAAPPLLCSIAADGLIPSWICPVCYWALFHN